MFTSEQAWVFLTPSRLLSKWYQEWGAQEESETSEPKIEAKPIVSMAYGASFINQIRAALWNDPMVQRGYDDNKEGMFKMPFFGRWATIVTGRYVEELAKAPDNYLSFQETINDVSAHLHEIRRITYQVLQMMQLELLIGPALSRDQIHLPAIRALTRRLSVVFPEIVDETHSAFATQMEKGKIADGWISIKAFDAFSDLISQLHHRAFVGLPLCRDEKWNKTMVKSATELTIRALLLRPFPESRRA
ncbi:hypothetical protein FRB91_004366 [Serendipita sp. 411]|nr:hypothetical protein FRB91_004366 [Serendipita sp. 411]